MGLIADAQADIATAFNGDLSDVVEPFALIKSVKGAYNATTNTYTTNEIRTTSRGVFEDYQNKEINDEIKIGDIRLIFLVSEIYNMPAIDDVINKNNTEYTVKNVKKVFNITYEVQLREV